MGKLNASTLASTPAPAAPAPQQQKAAAPAAPPPAKKAAPAKTEPKAAPAQAPAPAPVAPAAPTTPRAAPTGIVRMGMTFGPPTTQTAMVAPNDFYSTKMREVAALRDQRRLGTDATPPTYSGEMVDRPELTARAGPLSTRVRPKEGGEERVFSAYPTMEARTVPTSNQEEFVRRGERLGERYASLRRTLMDLADTRRELESLKKAGAAPKDETALYGATSDERLKSIARRTQSANRDMAQTLADLREFGIDEREAEGQYGSR